MSAVFATGMWYVQQCVAMESLRKQAPGARCHRILGTERLMQHEAAAHGVHKRASRRRERKRSLPKPRFPDRDFRPRTPDHTCFLLG
jgi:hypothetical protein